MLRSKIALFAIGIMLATALGLLILGLSEPSQTRFLLSDGSSAELMPAVNGKLISFYNGNPFQKLAFAFLRTNGPAWLRGYEFSFPASDTNGSLALELRHRGMRNGSVLQPLNGSERLAKIDSFGNEVEGRRHSVNFTISGKKVLTEEIFWEFPLSVEKEIHIRCCVTDATTQAISTNEFTVSNSAGK